MKEITYITIRGSIAFKRGQEPHIYLTDYNTDGPQPILTFTSAKQVAEWIESKIKERDAEPKIV